MGTEAITAGDTEPARLARKPRMSGQYRFADDEGNNAAHLDFYMDFTDDGSEVIWLTNLWVKGKERRKGMMRALMEAAIKDFGKHLYIYLRAQPYTDEPIGLTELKEVYRKHGFRDTGVPNVMMRYPG